MDTPPPEFKVLVADDPAVYRKLVEHALLLEQYSVMFAKNGSQAIELFSANRPALLITDWEMPDITGIELCERIRRDFPTAVTWPA